MLSALAKLSASPKARRCSVRPNAPPVSLPILTESVVAEILAAVRRARAAVEAGAPQQPDRKAVSG